MTHFMLNSRGPMCGANPPSCIGDQPVTTRDAIIQAKNKEISGLEALLRHCNGQLERFEKDLQVSICSMHWRL